MKRFQSMVSTLTRSRLPIKEKNRKENLEDQRKIDAKYNAREWERVQCTIMLMKTTREESSVDDDNDDGVT